MSVLDPSDFEFIEKFEHCGISKACWTHEAHVRMAWIQLSRSGSFPEGLNRIRTGIRKLNASLGSQGYHETVTVAFARLIHERILRADPAQTWETFLRENGDLVAKKPSALSLFYDSNVLSGEKSKQEFVEPTLRPLPPTGTVRMATEDDAEGLLAIYGPYIRHTAISFETDIPSVEDFSGRVREVLSIAPWLIYELDGRPVGYAYGTRHRARKAYQWAAEVSAYVAPEAHRLGIARTLYMDLLRRLTKQGYHQALAGVALPNAASVGFHESMGFQPVGIYRQIGFKLGGWHDVGWWQRSLQPLGTPPTNLSGPQ